MYNPIKLAFQKIAQEENGDYSSIRKNYLGKGLSTTPETKHKLKVDYKNHSIYVHYELGNYNLAKVECKLLSDFKMPSFEIVVKSHYRRIFNKKMKIINVKSNNVNFKKFLQEKIDLLGIEEIGRNNLFEPKMFIETQSELVTKFHLEFADKHRVIVPMIRLYESIIDYSIEKVGEE